MNNANNIMKQLPREQRPYEKCFMQGEGSLNDTELLAVILRSGTSGKNSLALAQEILKFMESSSYPGLMGLMHVSVQDLMKIHGIGQVKAVQLKCIGELSKRIAKAAARPQIVMNNPSSIAAYYMEELRHEEQELVICMMSDVKGHFLVDISGGGTAGNTSAGSYCDRGSEILQLQRRRIMEYMYRIRQQQRGRICYLRKHME